MESIRVLIADDHRLFRAGIRTLLQMMDGIEVVAEASNGTEVLPLIEKHRPHIVLMDLMMPGLNGLDATVRVRKQYPHVRVIMLSMELGKESVLETLRAGACGYLVKTADPTELKIAILSAARGEMFLSSAISKHVIDWCLERVQGEQNRTKVLPTRQREVLQLIAEGHTTKQIAQKMGVTAKTAESYRTELMKTLDIHDIASLTRYAIRIGLVSSGS